MATMINPRTGMPFDTEPDQVRPEDLVTSPVPVNVMDVAQTAGLNALSTGVAGVTGSPVIGGLTAQAAANGPDILGITQPAAAQPEPALPTPAPMPSPGAPIVADVVPKPAPAPGGGGGGGGGPAPERQLRADLARIQSDEQKVAQQKGELGVERAGLQQEVAAKEAEVRREAVNRQAALEQATEAEIAKKQGELDDETKKYKGMGYKDFWSDKTTGARVLGYVAMAFGAAGASLTGGPNYAMALIDKAIDRDYQRQRDTILKQKDVVTEARQGVEGARQAKADKLLSLENWRKHAYDLVAAEGKSTLSRMGVPEAEAEKNALVVDAKAKAFASKQALEQNLAQLADLRASTALKRAEAAEKKRAAALGPAGKPLTESQAKSADLAGRMIQDNEAIEKLGPMSQEGMKRLRKLAAVERAFGNNPKAIAGAIASGALKTPEQVLNDHDRLVFGAGKRYINSFQRGDSGGAISNEEYVSGAQMYLPQLGDKPQDFDAKRAARQQQIKGRLIGAGTAGAQQAEAGKVAPSTQAAAAKPARIRLKSGKTAKLGPDGQYYAEQ